MQTHAIFVTLIHFLLYYKTMFAYPNASLVLHQHSIKARGFALHVNYLVLLALTAYLKSALPVEMENYNFFLAAIVLKAARSEPLQI